MSETLCWWERGMRSSVDNIDENPQVIIFYRNSAERIHWRFHGRVTLHASGTERERAMGLTPKPELDRDPERTGVAALMRVESITELVRGMCCKRQTGANIDGQDGEDWTDWTSFDGAFGMLKTGSIESLLSQGQTLPPSRVDMGRY